MQMNSKRRYAWLKMRQRVPLAYTCYCWRFLLNQS